MSSGLSTGDLFDYLNTKALQDFKKSALVCVLFWFYTVFVWCGSAGSPVVARVGLCSSCRNERERRADIAAVLKRSGKTAPPVFFFNGDFK